MNAFQPSSGHRALVAGATGIVGSAIVERLIADGWSVVTVSRRGSGPVGGAESLQLDLMDAQSTRKALSEIPRFSHIFFAAYQPAATRAEEVIPNVTMLRNLVEAATAQGSLRRVILVTGAKFYGIQWGATRTPMVERDARHLGPNFYYEQEDFLRHASLSGGWSWCNLIPPFLTGFAVGNPMNLVAAVGLYANACKSHGVPLRFPGSTAAYNALHHVADTRHLAAAAAWAATSDTAANQAFNVGNDDPTRWSSLWPAIAAHLHIPFAEPKSLPLSTVMPALAAAERSELPHREKVDWVWADYMFRMPDDIVLATGKIRRAGFTACMDTENAWFERLDEYKAMGLF